MKDRSGICRGWEKGEEAKNKRRMNVHMEDEWMEDGWKMDSVVSETILGGG